MGERKQTSETTGDTAGCLGALRAPLAASVSVLIVVLDRQQVFVMAMGGIYGWASDSYSTVLYIQGDQYLPPAGEMDLITLNRLRLRHPQEATLAVGLQRRIIHDGTTQGFGRCLRASTRPVYLTYRCWERGTGGEVRGSAREKLRVRGSRGAPPARKGAATGGSL